MEKVKKKTYEFFSSLFSKTLFRRIPVSLSKVNRSGNSLSLVDKENWNSGPATRRKIS